MNDENPVKAEEVESLEMPVQLSADIRPLAEPDVKPIGVPTEIYNQYGGRQFRWMREAKERIKGILLDMDTWNVLWQIDGQRTVSHISENLMLPLETVIYHVECLKMMGIICPLGAIYLPEFILDKTEKRESDKYRRKTDPDETEF